MNLPNRFYVSLVVALGCEGIIAHGVALGAYNIHKFLEFFQTKVIHSLDRQLKAHPHGQCPILYILVKYNEI